MSATKFTEPNRAAVLQRIEAGATIEEAARGLDLAAKTLKGWLTRGRQEPAGPYHEFTVAIAAGRAKARQAAAEVLTPDEFELHLAKAVRAGSVQAMKLYAELERRKEEPDEDDGFDLL